MNTKRSDGRMKGQDGYEMMRWTCEFFMDMRSVKMAI